MMAAATIAALPFQAAAFLGPVWGGVVLCQAMRRGDDLVFGLDDAGLAVLALAATGGLMMLMGPLGAAIAWRSNPAAAVLLLVAWTLALVGSAGLMTSGARESVGLSPPLPGLLPLPAAVWLAIDIAAGWIPVAMFRPWIGRGCERGPPPAGEHSGPQRRRRKTPAKESRDIANELSVALSALVRMPLVDAKRYGVLDRDGNAVTISQRSLARFIGVSESTVNKHLRRLNAQGVVSISATDRQTRIVLTVEGPATIKRSRTTGETS